MNLFSFRQSLKFLDNKIYFFNFLTFKLIKIKKLKYLL